MMKFYSLVLALLLSACATPRPPPSPVNHELSSTKKEILFERIPSYAKSLIGTPYKFGGASPEIGFDCSGFVADVFRHTTGVQLPHSTYELFKASDAITLDELRSGDLVFFNTLKKKFSHVGIYIGDDRFIHAPSKNGRVRIESLNDNYWKKNYDGARRVNLQD
jgi:cell wall-associated NlpC family hydrolase